MKLGEFETSARGAVYKSSNFGTEKDLTAFVKELHAAHERGEVVVNDLHFTDAYGNEISDPRKPEPLTAAAIGEAVANSLEGSAWVRADLRARWAPSADEIGAAVAKALDERVDLARMTAWVSVEERTAHTTTLHETISKAELAALRDVAEKARAFAGLDFAVARLEAAKRAGAAQ